MDVTSVVRGRGAIDASARCGGDSEADPEGEQVPDVDDVLGGQHVVLGQLGDDQAAAGLQLAKSTRNLCSIS